MNKTEICEACQKKFALPGTKGRPPKRCVDCRSKPKVPTKVKEKLSSVEIVDRLEEALKRSGRHISQHREW